MNNTRLHRMTFDFVLLLRPDLINDDLNLTLLAGLSFPSGLGELTALILALLVVPTTMCTIAVVMVNRLAVGS